MNTSKIARYVWIGRKDINWYRDCEEVFVKLFGADRLQLVTRLFAATSINTSLKSNITLFRRAYHEIENGLPIGNYMPNIRQQIEQIRAGKELTGRKINSFARAMAGDPDAVVVDIWLLRAFDMDRKYFRKEKYREENFEESTDIFGTYRASFSVPVGRFRSGGATDKQYTTIENYVRQEARAMGLQPRQLCAMIWAGVRIDQSGDTNTHYKTILENHFTNLFTL